MHASEGQTPLLQNFQSFYYELLRQKERALRMNEVDNIVAEDEVPPPEEKNIVETIQKRLRFLLEEQALETTKSGFSVSQNRDAQYIMVALADDIFLTLNWPGAKQWGKSLLEGQLFQTQISGELFYKKLEVLLEANDPVRSDLALIYLMVLSLGFRGKYRDEDDHDKISWYREQLFNLVNHRPSHLFRPGRPELINECYHNTLTESSGRGLPDLRTWTVCIASIISLYIFVTYIVWHKLASEMQEALNFVLEHTRHSPLI